MRISDWSSDVCSSDLGGHRPEQQRDVGDRPGEELHGCAPHGQLRRATGDADAAAWFGHAHQPDGSVSAMAPWNRSEEHTSELQSLMRISYAVFCLKKKKN